MSCTDRGVAGEEGHMGEECELEVVAMLQPVGDQDAAPAVSNAGAEEEAFHGPMSPEQGSEAEDEEEDEDDEYAEAEEGEEGDDSEQEEGEDNEQEEPTTGGDEYEDEDEDEDEEEDGGVDGTRGTGGSRQWGLTRERERGENPLARFRVLPVPPEALEHELSHSLQRATSGVNKRHKCEWPSLDHGSKPHGSVFKPMCPSLGTPHVLPERPMTRNVSKSQTAPTCSPSRSIKPVTEASSSVYDPRVSNIISTPRSLMKRELGLGDRTGFSRSEQCHLSMFRNLPRHPRCLVDQMDSRAYIGQFSADGSFFVAAFQDRRVRLYDVRNNWRLRKDVQARMCRWTITDTCMSPDSRFLIYASITPVVHLVAVGTSYDMVESISNVTEIHEALSFNAVPGEPGSTAPGDLLDWGGQRSFGIWSVAWSGDGKEIIAGTNIQSVLVFDVEASRVVARVVGHTDDVNAVCYADGSPNIIVSGSDDSSVKVWDRRTMDSSRCSPAGVLLGHCEGVTHLDAKGDGRYIISNSKDQTVKLWDLRYSMMSERQITDLPKASVPRFNWDYRWMRYPGAGFEVKHPHCHAIATFRGHDVRQTLIRAYFSPAATTGQRYIYSGSSDGGVYVWDIVTGQQVDRFKYHYSLVRDCSWHPTDPMLASVSWDGSVVEWGVQEQSDGSTSTGKAPPLPHARPGVCNRWTPSHDDVND